MWPPNVSFGLLLPANGDRASVVVPLLLCITHNQRRKYGESCALTSHTHAQTRVLCPRRSRRDSRGAPLTSVLPNDVATHRMRNTPARYSVASLDTFSYPTDRLYVRVRLRCNMRLNSTEGLWAFPAADNN
ncbi:unnamed protein product [Colias eurytheme]|nr:unnamed protein product [Colias eurytheme]